MSNCNWNWDETQKRNVWKKATITPDHSPDVIRRDADGHLMKYTEFDRIDSVFGWSICHDHVEDGADADREDRYPYNLHFAEK